MDLPETTVDDSVRTVKSVVVTICSVRDGTSEPVRRWPRGHRLTRASNARSSSPRRRVAASLIAQRSAGTPTRSRGLRCSLTPSVSRPIGCSAHDVGHARRGHGASLPLEEGGGGSRFGSSTASGVIGAPPGTTAGATTPRSRTIVSGCSRASARNARLEVGMRGGTSSDRAGLKRMRSRGRLRPIGWRAPAAARHRTPTGLKPA